MSTSTILGLRVVALAIGIAYVLAARLGPYVLRGSALLLAGLEARTTRVHPRTRFQIKQR
jgi:hypothetical protein